MRDTAPFEAVEWNIPKSIIKESALSKTVDYALPKSQQHQQPDQHLKVIGKPITEHAKQRNGHPPLDHFSHTGAAILNTCWKLLSTTR